MIWANQAIFTFCVKLDPVQPSETIWITFFRAVFTPEGRALTRTHHFGKWADLSRRPERQMTTGGRAE